MNTKTSNTKQFFLPNETTTVDFGQALASALSAPMVVFLHGNLGAGKTTLVRGMIQAMGHQGSVKSPTYTLVEPYQLEKASIYHFDLYRLGDPEELEFMGVRDYFSEQTICFIEWSEKGQDWLPKPDLEIDLEYVDQGRNITLQAVTHRGIEALEKFIWS